MHTACRRDFVTRDAGSHKTLITPALSGTCACACVLLSKLKCSIVASELLPFFFVCFLFRCVLFARTAAPISHSPSLLLSLPCSGDDHRRPSAESRPSRSDGRSPEVPGSHSSFQLLPGTHVNHSAVTSSTSFNYRASSQAGCLQEGGGGRGVHSLLNSNSARSLTPTGERRPLPPPSLRPPHSSTSLLCRQLVAFSEE